MKKTDRPNLFAVGQIESLQKKSGNSGGGNMEARVAKLEANVEHIQSDLTDVKADMKEIKSDINSVKIELTALKGETNTNFEKIRTEMQNSSNKTMALMIVLTGAVIAAIKYI